jgi:xyloglucan-specific exo-beta-1,4-glucanase
MRILGTSPLLSLVLLASCIKPPGTEASAPSSGTSAVAAVADPSSGTQTSAEGTPYVWKSVPILGGGFVTGVIFSRLEQDLIYARTDIGGAYRWEPATHSWSAITDGFNRDEANYLGIESLAIHPTDPDKVYLAVGTYTQDWANAGAMLRSSDRGKTWQVTPVPFKMGGNENGRSNGERLAVDPSKPEILYFGSRKNGLWRSEDGSATWKQVESFPDPGDSGGIGIPIVAFAPLAGKGGKASRVIYAAVASKDKSLLRSDDAGASWKAVPEQPTGLLPSHLEFDSAGALYVSYGNQPGPNDVTDGAVYKLTLGSGKWSDITPLKPKAEDKFGYGGLSADPRHPGHLLASSIDRWTMKDEVWQTSDGGKSWKAVGQAGNWHSEGALYLQHGQEKAGITHWTGDVDIDPFNPARASIVGGTGVFMTENLNTAAPDWRFTNQGLEETAVLSLASPPAGPPLLSGVGDICGFRHDELDVPPAHGAYAKPACNGTTSIDFAELQPSFVARVGRVWGQEPHGAYSTDAGASWTAFAKEPEGSKAGGSIAVASDASLLIWSLKSATPALSRDKGATWTKVAGVREGSKLPDWTNMDLQPAADRVNPHTLYIYDATQGSVYVSHDAGASFVVSHSGLPGLAEWQLNGASITAVPGFEGHVWITTGKELFRSTDSGKTFEQVNTLDAGFALGTGKAAEGRSYPALYLSGQVAGAKGFFRSDDIGHSWVRLNDDAHQFGSVNIIKGDPRVFGRVYLGTSGRGVIYGSPSTAR